METEPEVVLQFCNERALLKGFANALLAVVLHSLMPGVHFTKALDDLVDLFLVFHLHRLGHVKVKLKG